MVAAVAAAAVAAAVVVVVVDQVASLLARMLTPEAMVVAAEAAVAVVVVEVAAEAVTKPVVSHTLAAAQISLDVKKPLSCSAQMPDAAAADYLLILNESHTIWLLNGS